MPILLDNQAPYYKRQIRCPAHWLIHPSLDIYVHEPVNMFKHCSDFVDYLGKKIKIRKSRIKTDAWGRKVIDWKKLYKLRDSGSHLVANPFLSASDAIENIYNPLSIVCQTCDKRCFEGKQNIYERGIQRLHPTKERSRKFGEL
jgi:hypothetical protein